MKPSRFGGERGVITIHVAIALIAMLAFVSFVADYGLMWVSRRQARNVADAAALGGAIALTYEGGTAAAKRSAAQFASENYIFGTSNSADVSTGNVVLAVSGTAADETSLPPCGTNKGCVRADVFRNEPDRDGVTRGTMLPTFFGQLVGITSQGVRATATAQTAKGNGIRCLLPFAIIDRWADYYDENPDPTYFPNDPILSKDGWSQHDIFQPATISPPHNDVYIAPYGNNPDHTGWRLKVDFGRQLILKSGSKIG